MKKRQQKISDSFRRLWRHISTRRRGQLLVFFLLMIAASLAEVVSIGAVLPFLGVLIAPEQVFTHPIAQPFISLLNLKSSSDLLAPLVIFFGLAAIFAGLLRIALLWMQMRLSYAMGADFGISIYERTLYQPYAVHASRNSSEVIAGITAKTNQLVYGAIYPVLSLLASIFLLLMILAALITINPIVALSSFAGFGVIYTLVIIFTRGRLSREGKPSNEKQTELIKVLQEGLGGIRDVLLDGTQPTYIKIYSRSEIKMRRAQANIQILTTCPRFAIEALGMVLIAGLAFFLAARPDGVAGSIPVLGALALGAQRFLPVMQQAYTAWTSIKSGQASVQDAVDLLDQPLSEDHNQIVIQSIPFRKNIDLSDLSFRYSQSGPYVLKNLCISLPKGGRIGFIGTTGSGKSTLLDIIMGLLQTSEGTLSVDGLPITRRNSRAWQAHIAHVPQFIFLADSTIAENIAFGVPYDDIDMARVRQAAQKAHIAETIEGWSGQYKTLAGERGVKLSGGQRQRIGIARALYKNADIIVFDEATSALDNETEIAVMDSIKTLGNELTIIIVAHRLTTLKDCTQVIELTNGTITRIGSYSEIVKTNS